MVRVQECTSPCLQRAQELPSIHCDAFASGFAREAGLIGQVLKKKPCEPSTRHQERYLFRCAWADDRPGENTSHRSVEEANRLRFATRVLFHAQYSGSATVPVWLARCLLQPHTHSDSSLFLDRSMYPSGLPSLLKANNGRWSSNQFLR